MGRKKAKHFREDDVKKDNNRYNNTDTGLGHSHGGQISCKCRTIPLWSGCCNDTYHRQMGTFHISSWSLYGVTSYWTVQEEQAKACVDFMGLSLYRQQVS